MRERLYESLFIPFGLANTPVSFQNYINDIFDVNVNRFVTKYLAYIVIYSYDLIENKQHVQRVLEELQNAILHMKAKKYEFHQIGVTYQGLVNRNRTVKMDSDKISAVQK